ncbi:MAG: Dna2/Cas4 domain-containing protein [Candidatus Altiarchaeales archaeon]|nr:Dna2/Cas4 domain-containing protein [Candidatus Altiarchaeales archaeon]
MISASQLSKYVYCPRSLYLTGWLKIADPITDDKTRGLLGHAIRKEFSLRQTKILENLREKEIREAFELELENVIQDAPYIYRQTLPEGFQRFLPKIKKEVEAEIRLMERKLDSMISQLGFEEALTKLTPWQVEYNVKSTELGLKGRIDKVMREEHIYPVEIKTGKPAKSVWPGDRIQVSAYSLLLEEKFSQEIPFGFVEYTREYVKKPVMNTEKLRRQVLDVRDKCIKISEGYDPGVCPHGSHKKCVGCALEELCYKT